MRVKGADDKRNVAELFLSADFGFCRSIALSDFDGDIVGFLNGIADSHSAKVALADFIVLEVLFAGREGNFKSSLLEDFFTFLTADVVLNAEIVCFSLES